MRSRRVPPDAPWESDAVLDGEAGKPQRQSDSDQVQVTDVHTDGSEYERHHRSNEQDLGQSPLLGHAASLSRRQGSVDGPFLARVSHRVRRDSQDLAAAPKGGAFA